MSAVVVVGGGIAGLAVAHALRHTKPGIDIRLLERSDRTGGNIRTEIVEGYMCEWGPDGFLDNVPETLALARAVGLESALRPSSDEARRRFIFRRGRLHEVPVSPLAFVRTPLLSTRAKLRIMWEPFARQRPESDETIFEFAARRIGAEPAAALIDSMVSGIFAGDARQLSLRACFPRMWQLETEYGGLFRALLATRKRRKKDDAMGAPAGRLTSFDGGMEELPRAVTAALGSVVRTSDPVHELRPARASQPLTPGAAADGYELASHSGVHRADAVVLAGPADETARLLQPFEPTAAGILREIPTAPIAVVCLGYDGAEVARERGGLNGFGFLVPRSESIRILGALWETSIYPHRAPAGKVLVRAMIGGALDPGVLALDDQTIQRIVRTELKATMGLGIEPEFVRIIRHRRGIPQYTVGHLARLQRVDRLLRARPGIFLAGNSYRGVSINSCIAEAGSIAAAVVDYLARAKPRPTLSRPLSA
ncbi:MAG TPA: protoporphyrinogen oxidase [Vicinamibacterales bacterium]|nr:protoporphyrinogen oxidase [Vicinamibacterales bacterium]